MSNKSKGNFLARHRKLSGYNSMRKLATESGLSASSISRIERNEQLPSYETLRELAPFLTSTSLTELMVVFGYWKHGDLNWTKKDQDLTEIELSNDVDLKNYAFTLDGKKVSIEEAKGALTYIRLLRSHFSSDKD
jgi:transcriptional regulator with XRE-family HTH domain